MASIANLVNRVRLELGDTGKSFVVQFVADGTTNRFNIHYSPLDADQITVTLNGTDVTSSTSVEESSGVLVFDEVPDDGDEIVVSGLYYRYFTAAELAYLVESALSQHAAKHTDSLGRTINFSTLPTIEEYPVVVYATSLALYTLATDSSFDIDIMAPDGVNIPRSERYRQLMEMMNVRKAQYQELCVHLGIGMFSIDIFSLRRISKATGRYVPLYTPQEVDDRSFPQRVDTPPPTYGDKPIAWPTEAGELTAYQGRAFTTEITFSGEFDESTSFTAKVLPQRASVLAAQIFDLEVTDDGEGNYTATLSLTSDQTLRIAERTYWSLQLVDPENTDPNSGTILPVEIKGGKFFTLRARTAIL
jgi:hypothetical protein